jgi:hypothetical protein
VAEPERFADVVLLDTGIGGEVGDGPRDPQTTVEPSGGQAEPVDGRAQQAARGGGRPAGAVELGDGQPCVR